MTELVFSKQISKRKDLFPWLKIFLSKLVKKIPNHLDKDLLQFFLQNVEKEVNTLSNKENAKMKAALFDTLYDLLLHFWWRIRWKGRKKWTKCWKIVSSEVTYSYDECTKCCKKLLYYIIYLGITLSNGCADSEWIGKVLEAIHILPSFDDMVYNSLLKVNNLEKKDQHVYMAILKHVLCSEVAENISEPVTYVKIIMLFRRLKKFTEDKIVISSIKTTASRIKPPSDTLQWLTSLEIDLPLEKHKSIAKTLLSKKCPNAVFHKFHQVFTGTVDLEPDAESLSDKSEEMDKPSDVPHVKHHKHKGKSHKSQPMVILKKLTAPLNTLKTAANSTSFINSKIKIRLNHEMLAGFNSSQELNRTEILKKKKSHPDNSYMSKKECNGPSITKASDMNEFLNLSFAEISNFSKSVIPQHQKVKRATKSLNDIIMKETDTNISLSSTNISSSSNHKRKLEEFSNGSLSDKRIKLDSKHRDCSTIQSAQEIYDETSESDEIPCLNSLGTLNYKLNNLPKERNSCSQETTSPSHGQTYLDVPNCNMFNKETIITQDTCNPIKGNKISLNKVPLVDSKNHQPSALLKLVQPLDVDLASSLHPQVSPNTSVEKDTEQFKIDWNNSNKVMATYESPGGIQKAEDSKAHCELSPNALIENGSLRFDINKSSAEMAVSELFGAVQETANSKQLCEVSPNARCQNYTSQIDCENSNSAIAISESSSLLCSTRNIDRSGDRFATFEDPSLKLCNSLVRSASWNGNSLNTQDHRWGRSQPLFPTTSKSLEFAQNHSMDAIKRSSNSEIIHGSNSVNQRNDDSVCITQNENTSHCVVDCKIVSDNSCNNESPSTIKVIINVTCKTPEDSSNRRKEHIFGNFGDKSTKNVTSNTSGNSFNSLNPFCVVSSTTEMPKLTPYYDDPPFLVRSIDAVATPPDSELDISVPYSFKRDKVGASMQLFTKKFLDNQKFTSTPKDVPTAIPKNILTDKNSEFKTPDTSDCETSNEWSLENTNLTNSLLLINSLRNSPINNVLEQLHSRTVTPVKKDTANSATLNSCSNKKVVYRSNEDIYSGNEFSDDSTMSCVSRVSATDNELVCIYKKRAIHKKSKGFSKQRTAEVVQRKRKNTLPKKLQSGGLQSSSSCIVPNRYNLRSREKLLKPAKLDCFVTGHN